MCVCKGLDSISEDTWTERLGLEDRRKDLLKKIPSSLPPPPLSSLASTVFLGQPLVIILGGWALESLFAYGIGRKESTPPSEK